ncbi:MAG TPA: hypothetical protein DC015_16710 [Aequorivita sp.]|nr:hypothetical protein [Aequorivita sp.]
MSFLPFESPEVEVTKRQSSRCLSWSFLIASKMFIALFLLVFLYNILKILERNHFENRKILNLFNFQQLDWRIFLLKFPWHSLA